MINKNSEDGFVLVTALLIMVVLTILGMAATNTAIIEMQIGANDRDNKQNFYEAEGSVMETAQRLENELADNLKAKTLDIDNDGVGDADGGLVNKDDFAGYENMDKATVFQDDPSIANELGDNAGVSTLGGNYLAVDMGIQAGASLNMSAQSLLHSYEIHGRNSGTRGESIISVGYKKRF